MSDQQTSQQDKPQARPQGRKVGLMLPIIITEVLVVLSLWLAAPYLKSSMAVSKDEIDQQIEEVKKRAAEREKREHLEREKRALKKDDAERLKQEEQQRRERKIRDKVENMEEITKRMRELREEKLAQLRERQQQELVERLAKELQMEVGQLEQQTNLIDQRSHLDKATYLADHSDGMKQQADALAAAPSQDVSAIQAWTEPIRDVAESLYQEQLHAREHGSHKQRRRSGSNEETQKAQRQLDRVQQAIDELATAKVEEYNDTSILEQLAQLSESQQGMESSESGESQESQSSESGEEGDSQSKSQTKSGGSGRPGSNRPKRPRSGNPQQMDMQQLYDSASDLERQIAEDFAVVRAAELSLLQGQKFSDAYRTISQNLPQHQDMDFAALAAQVDTIGALNQFRQQLDQAVQTTTQMWQNSRNMQTQAEGISPNSPEQQAGQLSERQLAALQNARTGVAEAAQVQYAEGVTVDLSKLMRQAYGLSRGTDENGIDASSNQARGGENMMAKVIDPMAQLDTKTIRAEAMPGRRFTDESMRAGWMYIDTWYVIGPWENNGLIDWDVLHPPEWELDLAKTYADGKGGKELAWQFTQSNVMRCTPPDEQSNSTYYCYTEVYFDRDRDMLLAIASDDAAKVWINDILVWQDNGLSSWSLDEGFRKVAFKQGFNRIMVRIENGPIVCQYSLLLCPDL